MNHELVEMWAETALILLADGVASMWQLWDHIWISWIALIEEKMLVNRDIGSFTGFKPS